MRGGTGSDFLSGDVGNDTYLFGLGDGKTTISNSDAGVDRNDVLRFLAGIEVSDVRATRSSTSLLLTVQSTGEVITVSSFFSGSRYEIDAVEFDDGTVWDTNTLKALVLIATDDVDNITGYDSDDTIDALGGDDTLVGGDGNDTLSGGAGNDSVSGQNGNDTVMGNAGNDYVYGNDGDDVLDGGDGTDRLYGGAGNDTLRGGTGSDFLSGDAGNDTYLFGLGDGQDTISNYDASVGNVDTLAFDADLALDDLWFSQSGNSLQIDIIGTDDKVTISNWYASDAYKLEEIHVNDSSILNNQLEQLVSAMSSFDVESEEMTPEARSQLQPIWDDILNN